MRPKVVRGLYVPSGGDTPLHVLTYVQGQEWVCHCLEYDLKGTGCKSQEAAFIDMKRVIEDFFERTRGFAREETGAAPELWQAWNAAGGSPAKPNAATGSPGNN